MVSYWIAPQVKLKIQNDKLLQIPDPFSLDWDNLSETELKRLVGQLEKTRSDLKSDLREVQWRLDKERRMPPSLEFPPRQKAPLEHKMRPNNYQVEVSERAF